MNQIYDPSSLQFFHCLAGLRVNCDMVIESSPVQRRNWPFSSSWIHRVSRQLEHLWTACGMFCCWKVLEGFSKISANHLYVTMSMFFGWFGWRWHVQSHVRPCVKLPMSCWRQRREACAIFNTASNLNVAGYLVIEQCNAMTSIQFLFFWGELSASEFWEDWSQLWAVVKGQSYHIALCDD